MRAALVVSLVFLLGTSAGVAQASVDDVEPGMAPGPPAPAQPREARRWYGWQVLAPGGLGGAGLIGMLPSGRGLELARPALALYFVGGPAIHLANGQPDRIPVSLLLELGAP